MYAIVFILITLLIMYIFYKTQQCSKSDLFGCFVLSLGVQIVIMSSAALLYQLYMLKPL